MIQNNDIPVKDYKVLVSCMTYNQSMYIEDALNGFVMQKTDFPFVCLVMDDASTDGEQDVITAWMERECDMTKFERYDIPESVVIVVSHKTNSNCTMAFYLLKENLYKTTKKVPLIDYWRDYCEYEALCEGDDYWIVPEKLQKQVEFLDEHLDYSMCFHRAMVLTPREYIGIKCFQIEDRDYSPTEIIKQWTIPTASVVHRINRIPFPYVGKRHSLFGDIVLWEKCAHVGKIRGISSFMSVYRVNNGGVTIANNRENFFKLPDHYLFIKNNFPKIKTKVINKLISDSYFNRMRVQTSILKKSKDLLLSIYYYPLSVVVFFLNSIRYILKVCINLLGGSC